MSDNDDRFGGYIYDEILDENGDPVVSVDLDEVLDGVGALDRCVVFGPDRKPVAHVDIGETIEKLRKPSTTREPENRLRAKPGAPHADVSRNWNFDEDASGLNAEDRDEQRNASDTP